MDIIDIKNKSSIRTASKILSDGGVFVFPTDTVYGIGCTLNDEAIKRLYEIKNRPINQPTAVLVNQIDIPNNLQREFHKYPKGKVTVIANINKYDIDFPKILVKGGKIGVRVPHDEWLENLLIMTGPIVASSANLAGEYTPDSYSELNPKLLEQVDLVIKTDRILLNPPSTIIDSETHKIIRN